MKKLLALTLSTILVGAIFTGCSSDEGTTEETTTNAGQITTTEETTMMTDDTSDMSDKLEDGKDKVESEMDKVME